MQRLLFRIRLVSIMNNTKTLFTVNVIAFTVSVFALIPILLSNLIAFFLAFLMSADGSSLGFKDFLFLLICSLAFIIPQAVFFYTFSKLKNDADIVDYYDSVSKAKLGYFRKSKLLASISVFLIVLFSISTVLVLIFGFG